VRALSWVSHERLIGAGHSVDMLTWDLRPGDDVLPGRSVIRLLGGGRRFEAYLAWDEGRLALVVAKVLRPDHVDDPSSRHALAREAGLLERLAHPHLVRGYGIEDGDRPGLALEFVEGPRLSTLDRRYGLSVEQLLPLAQATASALHYLHRNGVAHLDVKPRNIIMSGPPRLIDLSVARRVEDLPRLAHPVGTRDFMAPEQRDPARFSELGPAADLWGLGATLRSVLGDGRVPADLSGLVTACLAPAPADRPTAAEAHAVLEAVANGLPAPRLGRLHPNAPRHHADLGAR
jgi:eukaryotic-like serine/threonine-protein kinase